jgi:hypothetical protein
MFALLTWFTAGARHYLLAVLHPIPITGRLVSGWFQPLMRASATHCGCGSGGWRGGAAVFAWLMTVLPDYDSPRDDAAVLSTLSPPC